MNNKIVFEPLSSHPQYVDQLRKIFWSEWSDSLKK